MTLDVRYVEHILINLFRTFVTGLDDRGETTWQVNRPPPPHNPPVILQITVGSNPVVKQASLIALLRYGINIDNYSMHFMPPKSVFCNNQTPMLFRLGTHYPHVT
jgi:hypothetical protein